MGAYSPRLIHYSFVIIATPRPYVLFTRFSWLFFFFLFSYSFAPGKGKFNSRKERRCSSYFIASANIILFTFPLADCFHSEYTFHLIFFLSFQRQILFRRKKLYFMIASYRSIQQTTPNSTMDRNL